MILKLGQIKPLVSMVKERVMKGKRCLHSFLGCFYPYLSILADNNDMHESSKFG